MSGNLILDSRNASEEVLKRTCGCWALHIGRTTTRHLAAASARSPPVCPGPAASCSPTAPLRLRPLSGTAKHVSSGADAAAVHVAARTLKSILASMHPLDRAISFEAAPVQGTQPRSIAASTRVVG